MDDKDDVVLRKGGLGREQAVAIKNIQAVYSDDGLMSAVENYPNFMDKLHELGFKDFADYLDRVADGVRDGNRNLISAFDGFAPSKDIREAMPDFMSMVNWVGLGEGLRVRILVSGSQDVGRMFWDAEVYNFAGRVRPGKEKGVLSVAGNNQRAGAGYCYRVAGGSDYPGLKKMVERDFDVVLPEKLSLDLGGEVVLDGLGKDVSQNENVLSDGVKKIMDEDQRMDDLKDVFVEAAEERGFDVGHLASHVVISRPGVPQEQERHVEKKENLGEPLTDAELGVLKLFFPVAEYERVVESAKGLLARGADDKLRVLYDSLLIDARACIRTYVQDPRRERLPVISESFRKRFASFADFTGAPLTEEEDASLARHVSYKEYREVMDNLASAVLLDRERRSDYFRRVREFIRERENASGSLDVKVPVLEVSEGREAVESSSVVAAVSDDGVPEGKPTVPT